MTVATGASEQQVQELGASPWDSQHREFDYDLDDIEGAIPGGLRGALYRIGPGRLDVDGHPLSHIFDGDGMVSRIDIGRRGSTTGIGTCGRRASRGRTRHVVRQKDSVHRGSAGRSPTR